MRFLDRDELVVLSLPLSVAKRPDVSCEATLVYSYVLTVYELEKSAFEIPAIAADLALREEVVRAALDELEERELI